MSGTDRTIYEPDRTERNSEKTAYDPDRTAKQADRTAYEASGSRESGTVREPGALNQPPVRILQGIFIPRGRC